MESSPAWRDMRPYKEGSLRRRAARLPLLPALSWRSRRGGCEPPAGRTMCAPTKGHPAAPQCSTAAVAARPVPAVSQGRL